MTPLRFWVLPRAEVESVAPVPADFLRDWLALRPDVLDDDKPDIFGMNSRTVRQRWNRANELFEQVWNWQDADFIVAQTWLELLFAGGARHQCAELMARCRQSYQGKVLLWSWNHDEDQVNLPELQGLPPNELCLAYNSSRPGPQDIPVSFWNVATKIGDAIPGIDRYIRGGFIGAVGGVPVRRRMVDAFMGRDGWVIQDTRFHRLTQENYLTQLQLWNYSLCPRGGGLSSYRFFESLMACAVPVLFADKYTLPFQDRIDWGEIICRIPEDIAGNFNLVWDLIGGIDVKKRRERIAAVRPIVSLAGVQEEVAKRVRGLL